MLRDELRDTLLCVSVVDAWTIAFSSDSRFIASGSHTGKIILYSVESEKSEVQLDTRGGKFALSIAYVSSCCHYYYSCCYCYCLQCLFNQRVSPEIDCSRSANGLRENNHWVVVVTAPIVSNH